MARGIVNGFYDLLTKDMKDTPPTLKVGEPFKHAVTNKVHYLAWQKGDLYWITTADSRYGYLGPLGSWQEYASESKARTGAPGKNDDGWMVNDKVILYKGPHTFVVLAVAPKSVLLWDGKSRPHAEPNDHMEKFYNKQTSLF